MLFITGLDAPETPRHLPADGSWVCVEMAGHGGVTRISHDGRSVERIARTGTPNGLCPSADGSIWVAETHPHPSLVRVTLDGSATVVLDRVEGLQMLLPNDLCFGPDGSLYMTDSGILMSEWVQGGSLRPDWATAPFDGRVYRIDLASGSASILDRGIRFANGIALGPDDRLYVNEMITGQVFVYDLAEGSAPRRRPFASVLSVDWSGGFRGPDGMGFDETGRLFCTVYGEGVIAVIEPDGSVARRLETAGRNPTNVAWGAGGERRLYVTEHEHGTFEVFDTDAPGLPLYYGGSDRMRV